MTDITEKLPYSHRKPESLIQRYAWILLVMVWIATLVLGLQWFSESSKRTEEWTWLTEDREVVGYIRSVLIMYATTMVGFSIFGIGVATTAFRSGRQWAWYLSLYLPLHTSIIGSQHTWPIPFSVMLVVMAMVGLWCSRHKFFQNEGS